VKPVAVGFTLDPDFAEVVAPASVASSIEVSRTSLQPLSENRNSGGYLVPSEDVNSRIRGLLALGSWRIVYSPGASCWPVTITG
jgi:hypothetical protein